jgi:alkaline phosphatase
MKSRFFSALLLLLVFTSLTSFKPHDPKDKKPVNVILLIGDGMGLSQVSYALMMATERLAFERFKTLGLSKTSAANHKITDSAAGATALSCGAKTNNGAIGVDVSNLPMTTILEMAEAKGYVTGMVATCAITHATPASFIAHQPSREMYEEIAKDFLKTDIDLFIGGGYDHFAKRKDSVDLIAQLKTKGYTVIQSEHELYMYTGTQKLAALIAPKHLPKMQEGRGSFLANSTQLAINKLSKNGTGFFLMVEGSQIDWGGHANDAEYIRQEVMDFDLAIAKALDFATKDGNTLVIVTADHETGGFALSGNEEDKTQNKVEPKFTTKNHTGVMVPVYAFGPGAERLGGIYENTWIFEVMKSSMGLK